MHKPETLEIEVKEELAGLLEEIAQRVGMSCSDIITQIIFEYHPKMLRNGVQSGINITLDTDAAVNLWLEDMDIANEDIQLIMDAVIEIMRTS